MSSASPAPAAFPDAAILPKRETQADTFLQKYPAYDGRGVTVAIFDTGIDVGAEGLQMTSDGRRKIVNTVDASGSGDVDTTRKAKVEETDGRRFVLGLSGRKLLLGDWAEGVEEMRVGLKPAFELFSNGLITRYRKESKEDEARAFRVAMTALLEETAAWKRSMGDVTGDEEKRKAKKHLADLELRAAELEEAHSSFSPVSPLVDCLVFYKDDKWQVVLAMSDPRDSTAAMLAGETATDLADAKVLTDYQLTYDYVRLCDRSMLNCAIHVYDDGDVLSIVTDAGSHGSHVAGIVAGHYPQQPELDGIAPGAQIVAVKIGDHRLGSMETSLAMVRGIIAALENKVDLINMSYGEPTTLPNEGKFCELAADLVNKHNVLFFSSAGNSGPALSTVGSIGGTNSAVLGVGAYVSEAMQKAQYASRTIVPENLYTWTSRGPAMDGNLGVNFSAPGGAIAPVPQWNLKKNQLMNGTSMASPNACGGFALLVSALKAKGVSYSPHRLRRAVESTARHFESVSHFANGHGVIQLESAYEYLEKSADTAVEDLLFDVTVKGHNGETRRGIYLREAGEVAHSSVHSITVTPRFREVTNDEHHEEKLAIDVRLSFACEETWITVPDNMLLMGGGRSFNITIDPTALTPDTVVYTEVLGYDSARPGSVPLVRVPITVIIPRQHLTATPYISNLRFDAGTVLRSFFDVPAHATWMKVTLRAVRLPAGPRLFYLQTIQRLAQVRFRGAQGKKPLYMREELETHSFVIPVVPSVTVEVCVAQFWSSTPSSELEIEVAFRGIQRDVDRLQLSNACMSAAVEVSSHMRREELELKAELTRAVRVIQPKARAMPVPLTGSRNQLPEDRTLHSLTLTYAIEMKEGGEFVCRLPSVSGLLYENRIPGQLYMLFDEAKQLLNTGDCDLASFKVSRKGTYTLRLCLVGDDTRELSLFSFAPIEVAFKLASPVALTVASRRQSHISGASGDVIKKTALPVGARRRLHVSLPSDASKYPKAAAAGDVLVGHLTLAKELAGAKILGKNPWEVPVAVSLHQLISDGKKGDGKTEKKLSGMQKVEEKHRRAFLEVISGLDGKTDESKEEERAMYEAAAGDDRLFPAKSLARTELLAAHLAFLQKAGAKAKEIVAAAEEVAVSCQEEELFAYFSRHHDKDSMTTEELLELEDQEKRKGLLLAALAAAVAADAKEQAGEKAADERLKRLLKWPETSKGKYAKAQLAQHQAAARLGGVLKQARQSLKAGDGDDRHMHAAKLAAYSKLGWSYHAAHAAHEGRILFPPYGYTLF